jgi:ribosomal protein L37AE/L43A
MTDEKGKHRENRCPRCGSPDVAEIAYGLPSPDLIEHSRRGRTVLGGCVIDPDSPVWQCLACDAQWGTAFEAAELPARGTSGVVTIRGRGARSKALINREN